jgi:hypothetical protein
MTRSRLSHSHAQWRLTLSLVFLDALLLSAQDRAARDPQPRAQGV